MPEHRQGPLTDLKDRFVRDALRNPNNRAILEGLPALALPDAWLVAGCLFQSVWNLRCGRPPEAGIRDYDLFYFDAADLSADAEQRVDERVRRHFSGLPVTIETKNQARVHTWYADYFGASYAPSLCSRDGIDRFLVDCTCVGLQPQADGPLLYAPFGLQGLYEGILRPNPHCHQPRLYAAKAADYRSRWPWIQVLDAISPQP
ncbi:nucleotidyltransferase family protein [Variovorax sp. M-6]|uniref:nucleotidyltransferase family protein n=1 Tax=Variovorax sp. M-6 TaxID=3233041 RepID=UPI003F9CB214